MQEVRVAKEGLNGKYRTDVIAIKKRMIKTGKKVSKE